MKPTLNEKTLRESLWFVDDNTRTVILAKVREWLMKNAQGWEGLSSDIPAAIFKQLLNDL